MSSDADDEPSTPDDILARNGLRPKWADDAPLLVQAARVMAAGQEIDALAAGATSADPRWQAGGSLQTRLNRLTLGQARRLDRLTDTPARTTAGLRAKAEALLAWLGDDDRADGAQMRSVLADVLEVLA